MAKAPAHKFGQIIGLALEASIEPLLNVFAKDQGLYLDRKGPRSARRGRKVRWTDSFGNTHELDFVLEKDGTAAKVGTPLGFIEAAWRRYTKHSRNKAQEIQGAILPLLATHRNAAPFIGVILAGEFTDGALTQLKSLGFTVIYFPYEAILSAFNRVGVDAYFEEQTADDQLLAKVRAWEALSNEQHSCVADVLVRQESEQVRQFMDTLKRVVARQVALVRVLPLHGQAFEWESTSSTNTVETAALCP